MSRDKLESLISYRKIGPWAISKYTDSPARFANYVQRVDRATFFIRQPMFAAIW